mgnify:CR=1 FL=1
MKKLLPIALMLMSSSVWSISISVTTTQCGGGLSTSQCDDLEAEAETSANSDLPDVSLGKYAEGISNANGFAYKGSTSEYADKLELMSLKISGGVAFAGDLNEPEEADGFGVGGAVTAGLNLDILPIDKVGPIELSKLDLFFTFMSYDVDQDQGDSNVEGSISAFGAFARYPLVESKSILGGYLVEWGGVHLHTGFMQSKMKVEMTQSFEDQDFEDDSNDPIILYGQFTDGSANFTIDSSITTIPVELSTYLRLGYVFTLYGGVGFDYQMGSTDVDFGADGDLEGGTSEGSSDWRADVDVSDDNNGKPTATNTRSFVGLQFNVPFVRLYAQLNKGLGSDLVGTNLGLKIIY